jgi:uncharacterized protein YdaU (DUF1376 family)
MSNPPAFQFYPKQWLGDDMVSLMDLCAQGAHIRLMCFAWQQSPPCTIPNDMAVLAKWCGMSEEAFELVWKQVRRAWNFRANRWKSFGLFREWKKQKEYSKRQSTNAEKGWKRRRNSDDATAMPRQSHGNAGWHRSGNALQSSSSSSSSTAEEDKKAFPVVPSTGPGSHKKRQIATDARNAIENWQDLVDHIDQAWKTKKGAPYPWDGQEFKKLHALAKTYQAAGVMAMFDLYMQIQTYFGKLTGYTLDGLRRDIGVIVDDPRWKPLSKSYDDKLNEAVKPEPGMGNTKELIAGLAQNAKRI